jgi:phage baseplate assembly protein V
MGMNMDLASQIQRLFVPIKRKLSLLLQRALVQAVNDSKNLQLIKIKLGANDIKDMMERIQPYGLTSVPAEGSEALVGFIGGNRDNGVIICIDDSKNRKKGLETGDVCLYRAGGDYIHMTTEGIEIYSNDKVVVNSPSVILGGETLPATAGVVTGECICAFTGVPHADKSSKVKAGK